MPTYIRVKQIDPDELSAYFNESIVSNSGVLYGYIASEAVSLTGDQTISGFKTFNSGTAFEKYIELKNLGDHANLSGLLVQVSGSGLRFFNKTGQKFFVDQIAGSGTGLNTLQLSNTNTTLKIPNNKNGYLAIDSELVHNTGQETISGQKTFRDPLYLSDLNVNDIDNLYISGVDIELHDLNISLDATSLNIPNLVYATGDQIISGIKTFDTGIFAPNLVYNTGDQTIAGNKNFTGDINLTGSNNRIGQYHYIDVDNSFVKIKLENGTPVFDSEELALYDSDGFTSIAFSSRELYAPNGISIDWDERYLANQNGVPVLTWTGNNIGIGTNTPTEKLQVDGNIIANNLVYNTGNQTVSGTKTFATGVIMSGNLQVSGTGIFNSLDLNNIDIISLSGVDITITSGLVSLTNRPTVNGTGVLLSGQNCFIIPMSSSQSNLQNANTMYYFSIGSAGYSATRSDRQIPFLNSCVVRKVSFTLQQSTITPNAGTNITGFFINTTKNITGNIFTSPTTTADNNFYTYSKSDLNIPFSEGDSGVCAIFNTTAGVTNLRSAANIYCYN